MTLKSVKHYLHVTFSFSKYSRLQDTEVSQIAARPALFWVRYAKLVPWRCLNESLKSIAGMLSQSLQLYPTLRNPMDCGPPGSSVHGILQARILEWLAIPSSRSLLNSRIKSVSFVSCPALASRLFTPGATWEAPSISQSLSNLQSCSLEHITFMNSLEHMSYTQI